MKDDRVPLNRQMWNSFVASVRMFVSSEDVGLRAKLFFLGLISFLFAINGLNVVNSYVGRDFMTAIENRNYEGFIGEAILYICVFAASTIVAAIYRFTEERLGLLWREWTTRRCIFGYGEHRIYHRLKLKGEVANPDQRIADDIRTYTTTTLSFILMFSNAALTIVAFSGVLWSISPLLFVVAVLYAATGTSLTFLLGRPLVRLNYDQLDREANFRASLTYLRSNAESVALSRREGHLIQLALRTLNDVTANLRRIIAVNLRLNFFTTGYNWLIQIIPALIVAPLFIKGKVEFGVITQSAIAFTQLLGAFSLIITQFQSISSYTAVLARLVKLMEAAEQERKTPPSAITFSIDSNRIAYEKITLTSPRSGRILIKDLSCTFPYGTRVLVRGQDETARSALFHATGDMWKTGQGHIIRPELHELLLLTELPFLPPGTLRELLLRPWPEQEMSENEKLQAMHVPESELIDVLRLLKIETLLAGFGGFDTRQHWENVLPLAEQQLIVIARVILTRPQFAFLDRPSTTLHPQQVDRILGILTERAISYVTFEDIDSSGNLQRYDMVLELGQGGAWSLMQVRDRDLIAYNRLSP
ncbi:MAG: ABC transporter ATP-binding protein/permease [Desulfobacterota bacterium]|nr:ABC transporter ATP-binding protein/permease [Thermodesulfobacteriota bacterium]